MRVRRDNRDTGQAHLWDDGQIGGQAIVLWGGALVIGPPTIGVVGGVREIGPVALEGLRLDTVGLDVGYLRLYALVLVERVGIV